jgi:aminoglycoside 6'-N-acetyltransferase
LSLTTFEHQILIIVVVLQLRLATIDDLATLDLWDTHQHVIDSGGLDDGFDWSVALTRTDDWQEILIAELHGVPIGVIQIIDPEREETHHWGDVESDLRAIDI